MSFFRRLSGRKKKQAAVHFNNGPSGESVETPPVTIPDDYALKRSLQDLADVIKTVQSSVKKSKKKGRYDFREELSNLENRILKVRKCFSCQDDEPDHGGFEQRNTGGNQCHQDVVTVHSGRKDREPLADYSLPKQHRRTGKDDQQQMQRSRSVDSRKRKYHEIEEELRVREETTARLSENVKRCQREIENLQKNLRTEIKAKEEAQNRLSEMMGKKLKSNNPAITDLSDPGRPLSLVEKFSELYDNEWTDAIEDVQKMTKDENWATKILLTIVTDTYDVCYNIRHKSTVSIVLDGRTGSVRKPLKEIPEDIKTELKKIESSQLDKFRQFILEKQETNQLGRQLLTCLSHKKQYLQKCMDLCWKMVCHSPPVHLDWNFKNGQAFDHQLLKPFTEDGDHIDFLVWPVMFLHKDGPLLCKGVAQGYKGKQETKF